ncbi:TetR/AcrR family transcriptional regulator [Leifsonia poae]|uniref:TetR/AcrR family transcriptional regulator n=1 Tax=Leifsonia poae TaxID=110933 RepID=UPI001CBBC344|nr:TetR/AcrR family transcriptional regulator [Leifsonia poae]
MTEATSTPGPAKQRLTRDRIVQAGLDLASGADVSAISVRTIGAALGFDPTAAYRHFPNKQALMQALLDEVFTRILRRVDRTGGWQARLRELAAVTLDEFTAYPAIAIEATVLTTNGPGETETMEVVLTAFAEAGLEGADQVRQYALFSSFILSMAAGIAHARSSHTGPPADSNLWFEGPLLVDPTRHPSLAKAAAELVTLRDHDIYRFGVDSIIESAEQRSAD